MDDPLHQKLHELLFPDVLASKESIAELVKRLRHIADVLTASLEEHQHNASIPAGDAFEIVSDVEALTQRRLSSTQAEPSGKAGAQVPYNRLCLTDLFY